VPRRRDHQAAARSTRAATARVTVGLVRGRDLCRTDLGGTMLADPAEGGRNEFRPEAAGAAARRGAVAEAGATPDADTAVPGPAVAARP
jgi:hypothetical protein